MDAMTMDGLHAEVSGSDGPWVVLANSLATDLTMWDATMPALADCRVLRFDIRGQGRSVRPGSPAAVRPGAPTMADFAADAGALLDRFGIARAHWVGVSLGGMIGQELALARPDRLASLTLADTTAGYGTAADGIWGGRIKAVREGGMAAVAEMTLARWFTDAYRSASPPRLDEIRAMILASPVEGFVGCCEAIRGFGTASRLHALALPTLVLVGAEDQATPPAMAQALAAGIAGAELHIVPDAAHLMPVEQPAAFNARLGAFLGRVA